MQPENQIGHSDKHYSFRPPLLQQSVRIIFVFFPYINVKLITFQIELKILGYGHVTPLSEMGKNFSLYLILLKINPCKQSVKFRESVLFGVCHNRNTVDSGIIVGSS